MNSKAGLGHRLAAVAALVFVVAACGSTSTPTATSKGTVTIGGFAFTEGSVLAELYGQALKHDGYDVKFRLNLGNREVVAPALKSGQIDLYIGYASKLNGHLQSLGLVALTPSAAVDQNAFAVTKATAAKYNLTKLSDLAPVASQLVLGAGPECPTRPYCQPGLESVYGLHFKKFVALDTDGPATRAAFKNGTIDVGLVFSSDGDLNQLGLVVLQDDKHLEAADNVVPILRSAVATDEAKKVLNEISAKLTTADLVTLNSQVQIQHQDPDAVAKAWLEQHNFGM